MDRRVRDSQSRPIVPIILCGGSGQRLWPMSRPSMPKQFLSMGGGATLFQNTLERVSNPALFARPIVVTSNDHRFIVREQLAQIGVDADILLEPIARDSCAAVTLGTLYAGRRDEEAILLVLASDHHISPIDDFETSIATGAELADAGYLVTFGVKPTHPATSYGYLKPGAELAAGRVCDQFIEKPDEPNAQKLLDEGCLWNSGNFLFRADIYLDELKIHASDVHDPVSAALDRSWEDLEFIRIGETEFQKARSISVDHAVMERSSRVAVVPVDYQWRDLGNWQSVAELIPKDSDGNRIHGQVEQSQSSGNFVHSPHKLTTLVGVEDLVVVNTCDATLIAAKGQENALKSLVNRLVDQGQPEALESLKVARPWGNYEQLDISTFCHVKRLTVNSGATLSLQKHLHRSEHWVVVQGTANVIVDENEFALETGQSTFVPQGAWHRLSNLGKDDLVLIEVQIGTYFGEDDIIRRSDEYGRSLCRDAAQ